MKNEVEPYLKVHCREGYIPGAEDIYHGKNGITGKIHVKRYLAENPVGVAIFYRLAITYTCQNIWDTVKATVWQQIPHWYILISGSGM